jgi:hypothetical protein
MSIHQDTFRLRLTAGLAALCVVVLTLLAASPEWHARMHDGHAEQSAPVGTADHECAVTLFAGGVEALLVVCLLMLVRPLARSFTVRAADLIPFARPRYLLVPSHAPPAA